MKDSKFRLAAKIILLYILSACVLWIVGKEGLTKKSDATRLPENINQEINIFGIDVKQYFVADFNRINAISFKIALVNKNKDTKIKICIMDKEDKNLGTTEISTKNLENDSLITITFEKGIKINSGDVYYLNLYCDNSTSDDSLFLYTSLDNTLGGNKLYLNNIEYNDILFIQILGEQVYWFGQNYFICTLVGLSVIGCYIAYSYFVSKKRRKKGIYYVYQYISKYKFLLKLLIEREFKTKYKRSVLGFLWSFLNPMLTMAVQYVVFSTLFKSDIENYVIYLLTGIIFFNFFSEAVGTGLTSIVGNASLIAKVQVPKCIYPISKVLSNIINLLISLVPLIVLSLIMGIKIYSNIILMVFAIACLLLFTMGLTLILSAIMTFFRDTQFLWGIISMIWMYATPIFYPEKIIPDKFSWIQTLNPMYHIINFARKIILNGTAPNPVEYLTCFGFSIGALIIGWFVFNKLQNKFVFYI